MFSEMFNEAISEPRLASPELVWSESIPVQPQCSIVKEFLPKAMLQFYRRGRSSEPLGAREVGTLEVDELDVLDALHPIIALRSPRRLFLFADARLFL
jgi:hypothetical protein